MIEIKFRATLANCVHLLSAVVNGASLYTRLLILVCCLVNVTVATADQETGPAPVENYINSPELVGKATLKVLLWNIFDAELYATAGNFDPDQPFALALEYRRNFSSESIVEETIKQIESQQLAAEPLVASWRTQLESIIPDVESGMTITGIRTRDGHTVLYADGQAAGRITDRQFTHLFFNIWLGEKSSRPELRRKLLGYPQS